MKIIIVGANSIGLSLAIVLARSGHSTYLYDLDSVRISKLRSLDVYEFERYMDEPGLLQNLVGILDKGLYLTDDIDEVLQGTRVFFLCISVPPNRDGSSDMSYIVSFAHTLGKALALRNDADRILVAIKTTVPIGSTRLFQSILVEHGVQNFGVASNPSFFSAGQALEGSLNPDRIVVGADTPQDFELLRQIYSDLLTNNSTAYLETTPETSEAIKYISNALLFNYISFWNGVGARVGESIQNINMDDLRYGVTTDSRISSWGSQVGNGAGGPSLSKDVQSLIYQLNRAGQSTDLLQAIYNINEYQKTYLVDRAVYEANFNFNQKVVALLGLPYKRQVRDMRDSASIRAVDALLGRGAKEIRTYDPTASDDARTFWFNPERNHLYSRLSFHETAQQAIKGSNALIISTDWPEFLNVAMLIESTVRPPYLIIDGRRVVKGFHHLVSKGFSYLAVGGASLYQEV